MLLLGWKLTPSHYKAFDQKLKLRQTNIKQLMKWQNDGTLFHFCSLEMMMACWHPDASQRPSFSEIVASLDQALQAIR